MKKKLFYLLFGCLLLGTQKLKSQMAATQEKKDTSVAVNREHGGCWHLQIMDVFGCQMKNRYMTSWLWRWSLVFAIQ